MCRQRFRLGGPYTFLQIHCEYSGESDYGIQVDKNMNIWLISTITFILNSSPYYLLFGRDPSATLEQVHLEAATEGHEGGEPVHQFVRSQLGNYRKIFEMARKNLRQSVIKHQRLYRKNVKPLEVGDLVLVYMPKLPPHTSAKLHRHWSGPYQISHVINSVTYRVAARRPGGRRWNPALTLDRLRKFYPREGLKDLDKVVEEIAYWEDEDCENLLFDGEGDDLPDDEIDPNLAEEMEAQETVSKATRVQPSRAAKVRTVTTWPKVFCEATQSISFTCKESGNIRKLSIAQILAASKLKEGRLLNKNHQPLEVNVNSPEAKEVVDMASSLTRSFYDLNNEHYKNELPYHKSKKIRIATIKLFEY